MDSISFPIYSPPLISWLLSLLISLLSLTALLILLPSCVYLPLPKTLHKHTSNLVYLWHNRLGHPNVTILHAIKHCNTPTSNESNSNFCSSCYLGKSHKLPSHTSTTLNYSLRACIFWSMGSCTSNLILGIFLLHILHKCL